MIELKNKLQIKPRKEKADSKSPDISKSQKSGKKTKRKSNETKGQPVAKKQRIQPYEMPGDLQKMISKDTINKKAWANVLEAATQGYLVSHRSRCALKIVDDNIFSFSVLLKV